MAQGFEVVVRPNGGRWDVEVVRRRRRKRPVVEGTHTGFANEPDARAWGEARIVELIARRKEREAAEARNAEARAADARTRCDALVERLEAMHPDVYVRDAVAHGGGVFSMKIETPVGVYLDSGTEADWVRLVTADIKAAEAFSCPFCGTAVPWDRADPQGGRCPSCKARNHPSPTGLAQALGVDKLSADAALYVLENFASHFREDSEHNVWWGVLPRGLEDGLADRPLAGITGPDDGPGTGDLPLLVDTDTVYGDGLDEVRKAESAEAVVDLVGFDEERAVILPTCRFCVHAVEVTNDSDAILGVMNSYFYDRSAMCLYPLVGADLQDKRPDAFELEPEKMRGYRTNEKGILKNLLVGRILAALDSVDDRGRGLEAQVGGPLEGFHGPICRNFRLNTEHMDLHGGPYEVLPVTVSVRYGLVDAQRERAERDAAHAREEEARIWREAETAMRAMQKDPAKWAVIRTRIEKRNLASADADRLIAMVEANVPVEARRTGCLCARYTWAFNLSNSIRGEIDARLAKRAAAR